MTAQQTRRSSRRSSFHVNHYAAGPAASEGPELPARGQTHFTLEPSIGVLPWWELGGYLQASERPDGVFDFAGVKLRSKLVTTKAFHAHARLGLNIEVSWLPAQYEKDSWGSELRPILAWEDEDWLVAVNPIVSLPLAGSSFQAGPAFEPAAKLARKVGEVFAFGVEYYASLGPIASPSPLTAQRHLFFGALDIDAIPKVEINLGLGGGLTEASGNLVGKAILGYTFEAMKAR